MHLDTMFTTAGEQLPNSCNNVGQRCADTLFFPGIIGAVCTDGTWEQSGPGPIGASLPIWVMLLVPVTGLRRRHKKTVAKLITALLLCLPMLAQAMPEATLYMVHNDHLGYT